MAPHFLSLVSFYTSFIRRSFTSCGLSQQTVNIDEETTIHFWGPEKPSHVDQNPTTTTTATTQKPALVLIHGFGPAAVWQWRQQVKSLSPYFDLYVPDLVFFGDSTTKSSKRSEVFQAESIAKLLEKLDVKKYSVVGTSYGGFVTYHMARRWPERVEKAVIASSGVNMRKKDNEEVVKRANLDNIENLMLPQTAHELRTLTALVMFKRLSMVPDFLLNDFVQTLYSSNRKEKMELLKGLTIGQDNSVKLSPLQQEVLIVWGDHDLIFPLEMAKELKGLLGEKVRLEVIKNTSHVPQMEDPGRFNNIVKDFLCGCSSRIN